uniref:Uncharacterized protein n=1 Tax=Candidatus Kentrum sp. LFY TaxID=2126342 RepID=A0A450V123_9GAMM|nr:MAG: hypothetical protein BECKLFY1418B_GA0070995_11224 [Candidatus Kentron sp. LFY]
MRKNFRVESSRLLAMEGKDECNFFEAMLKHIGIEDVQLVDIGGKDKFKVEFPLLYNSPGFSEVRSLGFIRDAEDKKADAAFSSIRSVLEKHHLPMPNATKTIIDGKNDQGKDIRIGIFIDGKNDQGKDIRIGIFIMPNNADKGMLEDRCLASVREESVFSCVDEYVKCCLAVLPENERHLNRSKTKVQTYLAARKDIANSLGIGAHKGYWNLDHPSFDAIKEFLRELSGDPKSQIS